MKIATYIKDVSLRPDLDQALYYLRPPVTVEGISIPYVVVSSLNVPGEGPETYIFPATPQGLITSFFEMKGSTKGTLSHVDALANAGYEFEIARSPK